MNKLYFSAIILAGLTVMAGCGSKNDPTATGGTINTTLNAQVITDFSNNIAVAEYSTLAASTDSLNTEAIALNTTRTDANLNACRKTWRNARRIWEQSEAQLFGPVEQDNIDPHIDTWPVDFNSLDSLLAGSQSFTSDYINSLDDALKGFHPIEYILWGTNGKKVAADLTDREMLYLQALSQNVQTLTANLKGVWDASSPTSFYVSFQTAGNGSTLYPTQESALAELVAAMTDICNEVANSKMHDPYVAQDSSLEESPFAKSSMTDFINNITGIQDVYTGKFVADGTGIEDIVKAYNLSLDSDIKTKLSTALTAMKAITLPFGQAIYNQKPQVEAAMTAINDLQTTLNDELLPFVKQHSK